MKGTFHHLLQLATLWACCICLLVSISQPLQAQWTGAVTTQVTDNMERDQVNKQCIAIDHANTLHLTWIEAKPGGGWVIFYAQRPYTGTWTSAEVVNPDDDDMAFHPAMAINKFTGEAHIAYQVGAGANTQIKLASRIEAGDWAYQEVINNGNENLTPTIALDNDGHLHLAWVGSDDIGEHKIMYGLRTQSTWDIQTLSSSALGGFGTGATPHIAVDSEGLAHITYRGGDFGAYRVHYAANDELAGINWTYQALTSPNAEDLGNRVVVDDYDNVHVVVAGSDGWGFPVSAYYTIKSLTGAWTPMEQIAPTGTGELGDLYIDTDGVAHCLVNGLSGNILTGNLYYTSNVGGGWTSTPLIADNKTYNGALIMDDAGNGFAAAYQGNTFETQEVIVYGVTESPLWAPNVALITNPIQINYEANRQLTIAYKASSFENVQLSIFNINGQTVVPSMHKAVVKGQNYFEIPLPTHLASGMYLITLSANSNVFSQKIMID